MVAPESWEKDPLSVGTRQRLKVGSYKPPTLVGAWLTILLGRYPLPVLLLHPSFSRIANNLTPPASGPPRYARSCSLRSRPTKGRWGGHLDKKRPRSTRPSQHAGSCMTVKKKHRPRPYPELVQDFLEWPGMSISPSGVKPTLPATTRARPVGTPGKPTPCLWQSRAPRLILVVAAASVCVAWGHRVGIRVRGRLRFRKVDSTKTGDPPRRHDL